MASKIAGCKVIIGIDEIKSRLDLASSLGATHVLDVTTLPSPLSTSFLLSLATFESDSDRVSLVIDTAGYPTTMAAGYASLGRRGKYIQVGVHAADATMALPMLGFFQGTKLLMSCMMGDSVPRIFVPRMIQWYREGKLPLEKLVTFMPVKGLCEGPGRASRLVDFSSGCWSGEW